MNSVTDEDYKWIAEESYKLYPKKNEDLQRKIGQTFDVNGRKFQVIDDAA